jgi:hypothetical protein
MGRLWIWIEVPPSVDERGRQKCPIAQKRFQNIAVRFPKITGLGWNVARCCGELDPPGYSSGFTQGIANFFRPIATILQNDITGYGFLGLRCGSRVILKGDAGAEWNARQRPGWP